MSVNSVTTSDIIRSEETSDGFILGPNTTSLLGFYGHAPAARAATVAAVATTGAALTSYGYAEAQANAIVTSLNAVIAALKANGLLQ